MNHILILIAFLFALTSIASAQTGVVLTWTDNSTNEDGFVIERYTQPGVEADYVEIARTEFPNLPTYIDEDALHTNDYCYRVYAYNASGKSSGYAERCQSDRPDGDPGTLEIQRTTTTSSVITKEVVEVATWKEK